MNYTPEEACRMDQMKHCGINTNNAKEFSCSKKGEIKEVNRYHLD